MPDNDQGARIDHVYPVPTTQKLIQPEDVLLQVGYYPVGSDGTIVYQGNRVHAGVAFSEAQHGESLPLKLWRQGREVNLSLPVYVFTEDRGEGNQFILPRYYIYGGLVFTPLSRDYLRSFGASWADPGSADLFYELYYRRQESPANWRPEPIVLAGIISHPVNANLAVRSRALVDKINGVRIERLEQVIEAFDACTNAQHVIEFLSDRHVECLERAEAEKMNAEILKAFGISQDRRL
jgi:hypothetical protein